MQAGYSKTPLEKKLGIKEGFQILLYQEPKDYFQLFHAWPENATVANTITAESIDFVHLFCTGSQELIDACKTYIPALKKNGILWVSWPKGTSKIKTDLNRDTIRTYLLQHTPLVDTKVAAVDADWSGLKFVYRLKNR